jgi:uncharacterized protein (DUF1330 family)
VKLLLGLISVLVLIVLLAIFFQQWRYVGIRRNLAGDRQALFHSGSVFHVVSLLKLAPDQELLSGVREFVDAVEKDGAEVVYAGKTVINGRTSSQLPPDDWEAFVITQYPSRSVWDAVSASTDFRNLESRFTNVYSMGMKRSAGINLALPALLLGRRVAQVIRREPPRYPFKPVPGLSEALAKAPIEVRERMDTFEEVLGANLEYGREGMVIFNFAKNGTSEERKANAGYGGEMFALFAEAGAGPMHVGEAVTLEGDADFDQVIIVFYPGVEFFGEMITSEFYQGIFPDKQLGDDLSSLTVPVLPHL